MDYFKSSNLKITYQNTDVINSFSLPRRYFVTHNKKNEKTQISIGPLSKNAKKKRIIFK